MKHNPDDRSDNVERIQRNINNTIKNIEAAEDMMHVSNEKTKKELDAKNERRRDALAGMRAEIKEEADNRNKKNDK